VPKRVHSLKLVHQEGPDPDLAYNSILVASPCRLRLGVWRTQQGSGLRVATTWLCKCKLPDCAGWVLLMAVAVVGGYNNLVAKLFFWWGVVI